MGYRLRHPLGGRPLVVLGHYERTSGGCDTIPAADGGLDEIVCLADTWAAAGHDVLLEGSAWSAEYRRSAVLAANYRVHVLFLATPPEKAIRNLVARRRASRATWPLITRAVLAQRETIEVACGKLRGTAEVEEWTFDGALDRVRDLLGFGPLAEEAGVIW
jgi:predicted kinase